MKKVLGIFGLLVVLWIFLAINTADPWYDILGSNFLRPNNIENLLRRTAMYGLLGVGVAFVIIHSGIDLSIGSVVCLSAALLAIFLRVDYQPFDSVPVVEVKGSQQIVRVIDNDVELGEGMAIRFDDGNRTRELLVIESVSVDGGMRTLNVHKPLTNDHTQGRITPAVKVIGFAESSGEQPPSLTIAGAHDGLRPRDRVQAYHPTSGLAEFRIAEVSLEGENTRLTLVDEPGSNFSTEWFAVPLERRQRMPIPVAVAAVLAIGLLLGMTHGLLVTGVKLPPFVVTLCGLLIYRGVARWLVNDQPVGFLTEFDDTLRPVATGKLELLPDFGVPYPFFIFIGVSIVAAVFLNQTIWGRYLLALGKNEDAARYSGIRTSRIVIVAYMICTALAVTGGMLWGLDSNSVSPSSFGNFFELYAIAAAVLGGCSLRGGEGSILGVIIGTAIMQTLNNMIVLMEISGTLEFTIIGLVILIGVIADEGFKKLGARRRAVAQAKAMESKHTGES